jgi:NAD(P)-dependent dehydrogenase (short-subunit alcohol dehydrogenase family)
MKRRWYPLLILLTTLVGPTTAYSPTGQRPSQYYPSFVSDLPSMKGKVVAITGASRGLGFVTALALAEKGATMFLLNRASSRSDEALALIAAAAERAGSSAPPPEAIACDLLDFSSVRGAAAALSAAAPSLDCLVLNAGVMMQPDVASADGYDMTISCNVLSHFLLTRELLPCLETAAAASAAGEARVVSMSSGSGFGAPPFDPTFFAAGSGGRLGGAAKAYERYHQSKLANLIFTAALHRKLAAGGRSSSSSGSSTSSSAGAPPRAGVVKALACTPGVCATDMFAYVSTLSDPRGPEAADLSRVPSVEDGSLAQLFCAAGEGVASGELWGPPMGMGGGGLPVRVPLARPTVLTDEREEAVLWKACEEAVGPFDLVFDDGAPSPTAPALEAVRVAVAEEQEAEEKSFSLRLIASQVGLNSAIGAGLVYCYLVRAGAGT